MLTNFSLGVDQKICFFFKESTMFILHFTEVCVFTMLLLKCRLWDGGLEWEGGSGRMKALLCLGLMSWKIQLHFSDCENCFEGIIN